MAPVGAADNTLSSQLDESFVHNISRRRAHSFWIYRAAHGAAKAAERTRSNDHARSVRSAAERAAHYQTLGDEFDAAKLVALYTGKYRKPIDGGGGFLVELLAVKHIYNGPDWSPSSPRRKSSDRSSQGGASQLHLITPPALTDHVNCGGGGPSWVATLVNQIGESKFWNNRDSSIWDDWGGL
jgi:hypothetical protein